MKRPSIIAVVENGETRCGLTEEITGLGSLPYRLTRSCPERWEKRWTSWGARPLTTA